MRHRLTVQALAIALGMAIPSLAAAAAGVQYTPDLIETLVNKDVNNQRWAIARDNTTGIVTGNVFSLAGGPPQYVWCEQKSIIEGDVTLQCYGADACPLAPCPVTEWTIISPPVVLPTTFFAAPGYDIPSRYVDNGQTVIDNTTRLEWEKKGSGDGIPKPTDPNDIDNTYSWGGVVPTYAPTGTVFTEFIARLNGGNGPGTCYAGYCDWRLPTREELEETLVEPCQYSPCVKPDLAPVNASRRAAYWSYTTDGAAPNSAFAVDFASGVTVPYQKGSSSLFARAVRDTKPDIVLPPGPTPTPVPPPIYGSPSRAFLGGPSNSLLD